MLWRNFEYNERKITRLWENLLDFKLKTLNERSCFENLIIVEGIISEGVSSGQVDSRSTAAIQQRLTAVLRSIPKEAFADSFQKLYEHCQQCSCEGWRLF
jgi:hypothetical protein